MDHKTIRASRVRLAVASTAAQFDRISRAHLIEIADAWEIPFKTYVEALEKAHHIPFGTYDDIMWRFRTVKAFRQAVKESRQRKAQAD